MLSTMSFRMVHLITYGYVVDYGQFSFDQRSVDQGINIAR